MGQADHLARPALRLLGRRTTVAGEPSLALKSLHTVSLPDGSLAYVTGERALYVLDAEATDTPDDDLVVQADGPGRFLKLSTDLVVNLYDYVIRTLDDLPTPSAGVITLTSGSYNLPDGLDVGANVLSVPAGVTVTFYGATDKTLTGSSGSGLFSVALGGSLTVRGLTLSCSGFNTCVIVPETGVTNRFIGTRFVSAVSGRNAIAIAAGGNIRGVVEVVGCEVYSPSIGSGHAFAINSDGTLIVDGCSIDNDGWVLFNDHVDGRAIFSNCRIHTTATVCSVQAEAIFDGCIMDCDRGLTSTSSALVQARGCRIVASDANPEACLDAASTSRIEAVGCSLLAPNGGCVGAGGSGGMLLDGCTLDAGANDAIQHTAGELIANGCRIKSATNFGIDRNGGSHITMTNCVMEGEGTNVSVSSGDGAMIFDGCMFGVDDTSTSSCFVCTDATVDFCIFNSCVFQNERSAGDYAIDYNVAMPAGGLFISNCSFYCVSGAINGFTAATASVMMRGNYDRTAAGFMSDTAIVP
jgi:hypothetical protein